MNQSILMGRLTRDPEVRYSRGEDSIAIANFRLAVNRPFRKNDDEETADYFSCTAFGRLAEFAEEYLRQGIKVLVTGRLQNDNYKNRDGERVYGVRLILSNIEFAESKNTNQDDRDEEQGQRGQRRSSSNGRGSSGNSGRDSERRGSGSGSGRGRNSQSEERGNSRSDSGRRSSGRRNPDDEFMNTDDADDYAFN